MAQCNAYCPQTHQHNPHGHQPHRHQPHQHNPHGHNPHAHQPSVWPSFSSATALKASSWGSYFEAVYTGLPVSYPYDVSTLWVLHDSVLVEKHVTALPAPSSCPAKALDRYTLNDDYQPPKVSWIWHAYPFSALAANTWVEVIHEEDPFGDEVHGAWMLYTPGSGTFFDIGRTISFAEHGDAYTHFRIAGGQDMNSAMSAAAAAAGYDSVQFTAHVDHVNYPCDTGNTGTPGFSYMGLEIVAVRLVGKYACGGVAGAPSSIRRGWAASAPCHCDNTKQFLNCAGTPMLQANVTKLQTNVTRRR